MKSRAEAIALVPARGGSKGLPGKNIRLLAGKPLIAWTIETASAMPEIGRVIVSTEDLHIAEVARFYRAEVFLRPPRLAGDNALPADVVRHCIDQLREEGVREALLVYLQPTSPLRGREDIASCLAFLNRGSLSVATFTEAALHPHQSWRISGGRPSLFCQGVNPWRARQQLKKVYQLNGAVYAFHMTGFPARGCSMLPEPCGAVIMPRERSVDIDDLLDFRMAEMLLCEKVAP